MAADLLFRPSSSCFKVQLGLLLVVLLKSHLLSHDKRIVKGLCQSKLVQLRLSEKVGHNSGCDFVRSPHLDEQPEQDVHCERTTTEVNNQIA